MVVTNLLVGYPAILMQSTISVVAGRTERSLSMIIGIVYFESINI